jgi:glucose-1-phosphatase
MTLLFVFDMDNVLYGYDWRIRMALLTELTGHGLAELRRRWWTEEGELHAERGGFDADEYLSAFCAAMGMRIAEEDWVRIRKAAMTPWPGSIDLVRQAAEIGRVTLLTNNGALVGRHLARLAPELADVFGDHLRTSAHYGARKPDPEVFRRVLTAYETEPGEAFFADDLAENVAGAASVGISAHLFTTAGGMREAIQEFAGRRASPV